MPDLGEANVDLVEQAPRTDDDDDDFEYDQADAERRTVTVCNLLPAITLGQLNSLFEPCGALEICYRQARHAHRHV